MVEPIRRPVHSRPQSVAAAARGQRPGIPLTQNNGKRRFRLPAGHAATLSSGDVRSGQPVIAYYGGSISATAGLFALGLTGRGDSGSMTAR
jgi:hypothetical protein